MCLLPVVFVLSALLKVCHPHGACSSELCPCADCEANLSSQKALNFISYLEFLFLIFCNHELGERLARDLNRLQVGGEKRPPNVQRRN